MDDPSSVPDSSCTLALKPVWILPDGTVTGDGA
jgi:hypothetical protein